MHSRLPILTTPRGTLLRVLIAVWCLAAIPANADEPTPVDFERDVKPILAARCFACHGEETQESKLRLDRRADLIRGGESGEPGIVAGKAAQSELIRRVTSSDDAVVMPADGERLTADEIDILTRWIDQGAKWSEGDSPQADAALTTDFWSFQPLSNVEPPLIDDTWIANPIDAFILAKLRETDLSASQSASKVTLIRRLYLDMLGLPPTPAEVAAFEQDDSPDAWRNLVETVLASPQYGERWARHWLDAIRFAETDGFEMNQERPHAWRYRDWVIESLQNDKPYDQFVFEQLAGDAAGADVATGFLVGGAFDKVKSPDLVLTAMQRQDELADMINTTGTAFLGLTLGCAKCHNHKFDPILQKDYYAIQAVFAGVKHGDHALATPANQELATQIAELSAKIADYDANRKSPTPPASGADISAKAFAAEIKRLSGERDALSAKLARAYAGTFEQPQATHRLYRGDPMAPREEVVPDALTVLGNLNLAADLPEQQRRIAFAKWVTSADNPLTARVMVNRIWHYHFGRGIVATPSDFGANGARPTHPELLDWLAGEFIRGGWSIKHVHRLILLSNTYRQAAQPRDDALAVDADSRLLWRFPPRRLEAEVIRDSTLAVSGALDATPGGPGFSLFEPNDNYVRVYKPKETFGPAESRRMIYMTKIRMQTDDVFGAFDCPDAGQVAPNRSRSTTSIQALNLFNSSFTLQQSQLMAERVKRESGADAAAQVAQTFRLAFGREPDEAEQKTSVRIVNEHGLPALCRAIFNTNEFLFMP